MKRRILSLLVSLALCLALFPSWGVTAEEIQETETTAITDHENENGGNTDPLTGQDEAPAAGSEEDPPTDGEEIPPADEGETAPPADEGETAPPADGEETVPPADQDNTPPADSGQAAPGADETTCSHHTEHTTECGYVPADENGSGSPCTYVCPLCPIEEWIAALPESITTENKDTVQARMEEIAERIGALAEGEREKISNLSKYEELKLQQANTEPNAETAVARFVPTSPLTDGPERDIDDLREAFNAKYGGTVTLLKDVELTETLLNKGEIVLELAGHTIDAGSASAFRLSPQSYKITIKDSVGTGKIINNSAENDTIYFDDGQLAVYGGTIKNQSGCALNLNISSGLSSVQELSGGTFSGKTASIRYDCRGGDYMGFHQPQLKDLLGYRKAFYDANGKIITEPMDSTKGALTGVITVKDCIHAYKAGTAVYNENDTHKIKCIVCRKEAEEPCTYGEPYNPIDETYHSAFCQFCGHTKEDVPHEWEEQSKTEGLTISYYNKCKQCGYETAPFGTVTTSEREITLTYGETAQLSIDAEFDGIASYAYQWKSGAAIEGAAEKTYSLPASLPAGKHVYSVSVTMDQEEPRSFDFTVQVKPASITSHTVTLSPVKTTYNGSDQEPAVTVAGLAQDTDYTLSWDKADLTSAGTRKLTITGKGNYTGTITKTFVIDPAEPLVTWNAPTQTIRYSGSSDQIAPPAVTLVNNETFSGSIAYSYKAEGSASYVSGLPVNPGKYSIKANIAAQQNYTAAESPLLSLTIEKAPALTPKSGKLEVSNGQEHIYTYDLGTLLPDVPEGMEFGEAVTYELDAVNLERYYTGGAAIKGQTLTLPVQSVDTKDEKEIGTVTVVIHTSNFEDMTATVRARSINKIQPVGAPVLSAASIPYGQPIGSITLSGAMQDTVNNKEVPGTFVWKDPDDRPAVQEKYEAAWTFTPEDSGTYAIVNGTVSIQVHPAPVTDAVIELEPAAFRDDGEVHSPTITSVKLNGILLTEDVDYTAQIPQESKPGTYTVTITGKGNYTGTAAATFTINQVTTEDIQLPALPDSKVQLSVEMGLSSVPEGLKTLFSTVSAIEKELRMRVTAAISGTNDEIAIYDVRLQYLDKGIWKAVDPDNFPPEGVTAVLPYPSGTKETGYIFTVQHMISYGAEAGEVETLAYTALAEGLKCRFNSLSPVAVGYKAVEKPSGSSSGGKGSSTSGSGGSGGGSSSSRNDQYDFWKQVCEKIGKAEPGDTVKVNARGYDKMPRMVMDALKKSDQVTLIIRWNGGKDLTITSDKALNEALRIYYPLAYLTDYDFGEDIVISSVSPERDAYEPAVPVSYPEGNHFSTTADHSKQNPGTGGVWEINAPITAEAPLTAAGTPVITNAQRGLAETPELASQGVEKAIPGIYEPADVPAPSGRNNGFPMVLVLLLAAACGSAWIWKSKFGNPKNSK